MRRFDQINVIPFIDIMLVLLAIVLTTATFITQGKLDIEVPEASKNPTTLNASQQNHIIINKNGNLSYQQQTVTLQELQAKIARMDKDTKIILNVDKNVSFQKFVDVMDLLRQQDIKQLAIITKQDK